MISLILSESALELVPNELEEHPSVVSHAKKLGKYPSDILLDNSWHFAAMKGIKNEIKRGRPDLVHFSILEATTIPLYYQNESNIEFMTWFRYIDQQPSSCVTEEQKIGDQTITLGGGSSMGTSEHVIERLNQYNWNTGFVDVNQNDKIGWNEFKTQIQMLN